MTDDELIEAWINGQTMQGRSPRTLKRRRSSAERYVKHRGGRGDELATSTARDIEGWLAALPITPQSRGMYLSDLRAFYHWAIRHDYLEADPTVKVDAPKRPRYLPNPIPTDQLKRAIAQAPERERLMLSLAGYAGLRAMEIAGLRYDDIDWSAEIIRVAGKGQRDRLVTLHPLIAEQLDREGVGPVVAWRGKPISAATVSARLSRYLKGLGLKYTGHKGRHSFGTRLYEETRDIRAVQETLGHSSMETTKGYVAHSPEVARRGILALD